MAKGKPKRGSNLGKQLIKSKYKKHTLNKETLGMYTTDIDAREERKKQFASQTDSGNMLDQFIEQSEMEQKVFEAEKQNVVVLLKTSSTVMTQEERTQRTLEHQQVMEKNKLFWNSLTIPRRPYWDETTTTEELLLNEKESFYNWRKGLAKLEEEEGLIVTPYEKNPEILFGTQGAGAYRQEEAD
ncbi:GTPase [Cavenderia fasciculata]|uniref:GTPase n=1 Tax=Cavenderia fasciculata TaxID=261658 RepID=F4PXL0_CACFS|nr:GTPase [Cavenderia fasciculata]EGG19520.1 GTPase [Cavenderia fasciculata]|eukprot:XP_004357814.1 GTPase [Cavenderia fasciculata]